MNGDRVALPKVWVSPESRAGWVAYCAYHGVTRSALIEAMGVTMGEMATGARTSSGLATLTVERARLIDRERRRRS